MNVTLDPTAATPSRLADLFGVGLGLEARVLMAARECVAVNGWKLTTIDDVAAAAGCGRASVYRLFPGGRHSLMRAVVAAEVQGLLEALAIDVDAAPDLASAVAGALHTVATHLAGHGALQRLLAHEPGAVMPFIAFDGAAPVLAMASTWARVHLARFLSPHDAELVGEWVARLVLSHLDRPGDLTPLLDAERARRLVDTYLMPGLHVPVPL